MENKPNKSLARRLNLAAYIISAIVLLLVVFMRYIHLDTGVDFSFLPPFHASLNAITAVVLIIAFIHIRAGRIESHKKSMYWAIGLSVLFLLSYVLYHITTPPTIYGGEGAIKYVYYFLLITHVILAAVIFPFILFTFIRAYTGQFQRHKSMARWVFPIWLYVAITGPVCYLMLMPYY